MLILLVIVILLTVYFNTHDNTYAPGCGTSPRVDYYLKLLNDTYEEPSNRVYIGDRAEIGSWPWLVSILVTFQNGSNSLCTGSIVGKTWILTAAHCIHSSGDVKYTSISYDSVEINPITNKIAYASKYFVHPDYTTQIKKDDIALIQLKSTIRFSDTVHALCLGRNIQPVAYETTFAVGYGREFRGHKRMKSVNYAREAMMDISLKGCEQNKKVVCTYGINQGTTKGDSGGSLMVIRDNRFYSIGVVSMGSQTPITNVQSEVHSFYTRTSAYCDWIAETTAQEVNCDDKTFDISTFLLF